MSNILNIVILLLSRMMESPERNNNFKNPEFQDKISKVDSKMNDELADARKKKTDLKIAREKNPLISRRKYPLRKTDNQEQDWDETQRVKVKQATSKEESPLQCYVKIIDYLKKIQWDEANSQNKMNPFQAMTANCFWFMISAEYYSYNFYKKKNPNQIAHQYLTRVLKQPVGLPSRIMKSMRNGDLLEFQTENLRQASKPIAQKLNQLIPAPLNSKSQSYDKGSSLTTCAQDDAFRSSTRAWVFNYIKGKMQSSEKWNSNLALKLKSGTQLPSKNLNKKMVYFHQQESDEQQGDPNVLLFRQRRKSSKKRDPTAKKNARKNIIKQEDNNDGQNSKIFEDQQLQNNDRKDLQQNQPQYEEMDIQKNQQNQANQANLQRQNSGQSSIKIQKDIQKLSMEKQEDPQLSVKNQVEEEEEMQQIQENDKQSVKESQEHENQVNQSKEKLVSTYSKEMVQQPHEQQEEQIQPTVKFQQIPNEKIQEQMDRLEKNQEKIRIPLNFTSVKDYNDDDVLLDAILHLPLEKIISVLQSILPRVQLPEITTPFLPQPQYDPLELVFQLHDDEEKYLEYMKENRSKLYKKKKQQQERQRQMQKQLNQLVPQIGQPKSEIGLPQCKRQMQMDIENKEDQKQNNQNQVQVQQKQLGQRQEQNSKESNANNSKQEKMEDIVPEIKYGKHGKGKHTSYEDEVDSSEVQDAKCQICTDGDYTDDNLIVFCSTCNISLHQRCVGLAKVPAQSWVCQLCQAFGPAGINVPCPLCNVKGGALKRTTIHIDTQMFKEINPQYHQFCKSCTFNRQKQEYIPVVTENPIVAQQSAEKNQKQDHVYYDYFRKSTQNNTLKPNCHYVWTHYVCAIWVPQCYFEEKNGLINIKGIETIDKKRFRLECTICKTSRAGACVKCQQFGCQKYYHPECARKKKVYMEQLNLEKLKYLIFCEEHQPLKLMRQIQYRKKKSRDQIVKFCRMIEKYVDTYKIVQLPFKLHKNVLAAIQAIKNPEKMRQTITTPAILSNQKKSSAISSKNDDEQFVKSILQQLQKNTMFIINLEKVKVQNAKVGYKVVNVAQPSKRAMRKSLSRYDDFWTHLNNDQAEKNYNRYSRILNENAKLRAALERFLSGSVLGTGVGQFNALSQPQKKGQKARRTSKRVQKETQIQEQGGIFCVCRKPYEGQTDMIECEICGQWYHFDCIGYTGGEQQAQNMQFHCMKCMKFQENQQANLRMKKYKNLFKFDSLFFNYRPPTPQLHSEDQIDEENKNKLEQKPSIVSNEVKNQSLQEESQQPASKHEIIKKEENNLKMQEQKRQDNSVGRNIEAKQQKIEQANE